MHRTCSFHFHTYAYIPYSHLIHAYHEYVVRACCSKMWWTRCWWTAGHVRHFPPSIPHSPFGLLPNYPSVHNLCRVRISNYHALSNAACISPIFSRRIKVAYSVWEVYPSSFVLSSNKRRRPRRELRLYPHPISCQAISYWQLYDGLNLSSLCRILLDSQKCPCRI